MSSPKGRRAGKGAVELIEEATHLLRLLPAGPFTVYYTGSLPFVLGLLYFWADMSRGAFAHTHVAGTAFSMAILFIWMKWWHAVFLDRLGSHIRGDGARRWSLREMARILAVQAALQPAGLFVLPVALALTVPFGWAYAFFQNVSCLAGAGNIGKVYEKARKQALLFPGQNNIALSLLFIFGFFVFLNIFFALYIAPTLLNMFFGFETSFSMSGLSLFNTTLSMAAAGLTFLVMDPLVKTLYALRCFYGESLRTGDDLRVGLGNCTRSKTPPGTAVVLLIILLLSFQPGGAPASPSPSSTEGTLPAPSVSASEIDESIRGVIGKADYSWRMPRPKLESKKGGLVSEFITGALDTLGEWFRPVGRWLKKALEWLVERLERFIRIDQDRRTINSGWPASVYVMLYAILGALSCLLAVMLWRRWRKRTRARVQTPSKITPPDRPDLSDDNVSAAELPANRWMDVALELAGEGDLRLALRAVYLAGLAHLSLRGRITIAAFKSNRDYERELQRKAHDLPDLLSAFSHNTRIFESIWYGTHEVTEEIFSAFNENQKRIMAIAAN